MCLVKALSFDKETGFYSLPNEPVDINLADYINRFSFFQYIHKDKLKDFEQAIGTANQKSFIADIAAAVIAKLYEKKPDVSTIKLALECCHAILERKGYHEDNFDLLLNKIPFNQFDKLMVITPGCQTTSFIEQRVDATIRIVQKCIKRNKPVEVVFSGWRPSSETPKIQNESMKMYNLFLKKLKQKKVQSGDDFIQIRTPFIEEESRTTSENIKKFFDGGYINKDITYELCGVTSTFHLLRLSDDLEKVIGSEGYHGKIRNIILYGAEGDPHSVSKQPRYIKLMFYDLFSYLMSQESFLKGRDI